MPSTSQSFVDDDEEVVFKSLKTKKQKLAKKHSLKSAVDANQSAVRKH